MSIPHYVTRELAQPVSVSTRRYIPRSEVETGYAPLKAEAVCVSETGRLRAAHLEDGRGRCILCGKESA